MAAMDVLGLPDPADYNPPTNDPLADHARKPPTAVAPAPSATVTGTGPAQTDATTASAPAPTTQTITAQPAVTTAPVEAEVTPFPPAAPTVTGVDVTESVYQAGA